MSLYDMNTKQFVFAYLKECVSQYYIYTYIDICFFFLKILGPHNSLCLVLNLKVLRKS